MKDREVINIEFEDGDEDFKIMGTFMSGGKEYIALLPCVLEETEDLLSTDIFLCRYFEAEDGFEIEEIDDKNEKQSVFKDFDTLFNNS